MSRHISLAAVLLLICLAGLAAQPASACWTCQQKLVCDPGGGCMPFAICAQIDGFCTNCSLTCTSAPGLCNRDANSLCQWAQSDPGRLPFELHAAQPAARLCAVLS